MQSLRVWLDKSEKHATVGAFIDFQKGDVLIRSRTGKEISVKITKLSKEDQKWVREAIKGMK
jgi:hypothetical protein